MRYLKVYHVRVMRQGPRGYVRDGRAAECSQIVTYSLQEWNDPFSSFCEALIPKTRANASLTFIWNPSSRNQVNDLTLQIRCFYLVSILLKHCDSGSQLVLSFIFWLFLFLSQNFSLHHVFRCLAWLLMAFKAAFADVRKTLEKELNVSYRLLNELRRTHVISQSHVEILMVICYTLLSWSIRY